MVSGFCPPPAAPALIRSILARSCDISPSFMLGMVKSRVLRVSTGLPSPGPPRVWFWNCLVRAFSSSWLRSVTEACVIGLDYGHLWHILLQLLDSANRLAMYHACRKELNSPGDHRPLFGGTYELI
jgi:hypothetical protein